MCYNRYGEGMKKILWLVVIFMIPMMLFGCGERQESNEESSSNKDSEVSSNSEEEVYLTGLHHVEIEIENYGTIAVELNADQAPITVTNFVSLARSGFYDGTTFHRIINGFMMQGGAAKAGKHADTIKGEFSSNGVENTLLHNRGAISMARANDKNSASSQFFIVQGNAHHLDGEYAVFGYVTSGMDIVDKICSETKIEDDNGTVLEENQPIIKTIRVLD